MLHVAMPVALACLDGRTYGLSHLGCFLRLWLRHGLSSWIGKWFDPFLDAPHGYALSPGMSRYMDVWVEIFGMLRPAMVTARLVLLDWQIG